MRLILSTNNSCYFLFFLYYINHILFIIYYIHKKVILFLYVFYLYRMGHCKLITFPKYDCRHGMILSLKLSKELFYCFKSVQ